VDQNGDLLTRTDAATQEMDLTAAQFGHVRRVEEAYVKRIEHILAPLAGPDGVRAQVTVDMDFGATEQTREVYNPDQTALRSEQTVEEQTRGPGESGIPGALSNQPPAAGTVPEKLNSGSTPPVAGQGVTATGTGDTTTTKHHATRNYELDRTISHSRGQIGQVRRVSAAVVVNDAFRPGSTERMARSPEEMERIRALVREAVGYDPQRGDAVSVVNASFVPGFGAEEAVEAPLWRQPWAIDLARQALAALLILLLGLGVLRPVMRRLAGEEKKPTEAPEAPAEADGETREVQPTAEGAEGALPEDQLSLSGAVPGETAQIEALKSNYETHLEQIRRLIQEEPKLVSQAVKNWINADE
jgi:flagellar M-ring protein FliF